MKNTTSSTKISELLPLTPAVLHILLVLSSGPMHGYAIMREVDQISNGKIKMGPGTLYGTLKRMLRDNLIVEIEEPQEVETEKESRRYYQLTEAGRKTLSAEIERLISLMEIIREKAPFRKVDGSLES